MRRTGTVITCALALSLTNCAGGTGAADSAVSTIDAAAVADAGAAVDSVSAVCDYARPPVLVNMGGAVLRAPEIVYVTFADDPDRIALEEFSQWITTSAWFERIGRDYDVRIGHVASVVRLPTAAPSRISPDDIPTWIATAIANGTVPMPANGLSNALYVVYFPATTSVELDEAGQTWRNCIDYGAYHDEASYGEQRFAFAVVPHCTESFVLGLTPLEWQEVAASHEIAEAVTDPLPETRPGFVNRSVQAPGVFEGFEVGDLCEDLTVRYGPYAVQQIWSNTAAAAGSNPCVPGDPAAAFFDTAVVTRPAMFTGAGFETAFNVQGWSTRPIADWNVTTTVYAQFEPAPTVWIDHSSLNHCDTATVHVQIPPTAPAGEHVLIAVQSGNPPLETHAVYAETVVTNPVHGSCVIQSDAETTCVDFGDGYSARYAQEWCAQWEYSPMRCPISGRIGRCIYTSAYYGSVVGQTYNFYPPTTQAQVVGQCVTVDNAFPAFYVAN